MPLQEVPLTGITRLICIRGNSYSEFPPFTFILILYYITVMQQCRWACADTLCIIPVWYVAPTIILRADIIIAVKYKYNVVWFLA